MPKVQYTTAKGLHQVTGKGVTSAFLTSQGSQGAGTAIANDTDAVALVESDSGKIFTCALASAAKTITIPAGLPLGWNVKIVQIANLASGGALTVNLLDGTDFCAVGSYGIQGGPAAGDAAVAADDSLVITGQATNSGWGIGSVLTITKVADNRLLFEAIGAAFGTGAHASIAFAAQ